MAKDVNMQKEKREKYFSRRRCYNPDDEEYQAEQAEGPVGQL
jgi:hypothetical protein